MRLTWTRESVPDLDSRKPVDAALAPHVAPWRLNDETGAEVARVEKSPPGGRRGPVWTGRISRRLYREGRIPAWVTRRGAQAARRAIQDCLAAECRWLLDCEPDELEFFTDSWAEPGSQGADGSEATGRNAGSEMEPGK